MLSGEGLRAIRERYERFQAIRDDLVEVSYIDEAELESVMLAQDIPALLAHIEAWAPVIEAAKEEKMAWEAWCRCENQQESIDLLFQYSVAAKRLLKAAYDASPGTHIAKPVEAVIEAVVRLEEGDASTI